MILVSCRKNFDDDKDFASDIAIRNYTNLGQLGRYETLDPEALVEEVRAKHLLVLIHGYRSPLKTVVPAFARLEQGLSQHGLLGAGMYGNVIGFLWPGHKAVLSLPAAKGAASRSAGPLRNLLLLAKASASSIDVQTHSLGARVALQALAFPPELYLDNLLLSAPAVDNECLEPGEEYNTSLESCRRCFVYHSRKDGVLRAGYLAGTFDRALGFKGPQHPNVIKNKCPDVFVVDCSAAVKSHGGYRKAAKYYEHWGKVLRDEPLNQFDKL